MSSEHHNSGKGSAEGEKARKGVEKNEWKKVAGVNRPGTFYLTGNSKGDGNYRGPPPFRKPCAQVFVRCA